MLVNINHIGFKEGGNFATMGAFSNRSRVVYSPYDNAMPLVLMGVSVYMFVAADPIAGAIYVDGTAGTSTNGDYYAVLEPAFVAGTAAASATAFTKDTIGYYMNKVLVRDAVSHDPLTTPLGFEVFALLQCSNAVVDHDAIDTGAGTENLQLSFVYEDAAGVLQLFAVTGTVEIGLRQVFAEKYMPVIYSDEGFKGADVFKDLTYLKYSLLADIKAASGIDQTIATCIQNETIYRYLAAGAAYTANDKEVLITGDGGNTRWIALGKWDTFVSSGPLVSTNTNDAINELAAWSPHSVELVNRTIYVQTVSGDDVLGDGTLGNPFQTIARALRSVLGLINAGVAIYIALDEAGTYNIPNTIGSEIAQHVNDGIISIGSTAGARWPLAAVDSGTFTAEGHFLKTDAGKVWVADAYAGMFVLDVDTGVYYPIAGNNGTQLYIGGNATLATVVIGDYEIYDLQVTVTSNLSSGWPKGEWNFNYINFTAAVTFIDLTLGNLSPAFNYCNFTSPYIYSRSCSFANSVLQLTDAGMTHLLGSVHFCGVRTNTPIFLDNYWFEVCTIPDSAGFKAITVLTGYNYGNSFASQIKVRNCYTFNFLSLVGREPTYDCFPESITVGGEFEWDTVTFMVYGFPGLHVKQDPDYPITNLNAGSLTTGLLTTDGINEAGFYLDAYNDINALAIAPNDMIAINFGRNVNPDVDIATSPEVVDSFPDTVNASAVRWDILIQKGAAKRMCSLNAVWDAATNAIDDSGEYGITEIGVTADLTLAVSIVADVVTLSATAVSDDWSVTAQRTLI